MKLTTILLLFSCVAWQLAESGPNNFTDFQFPANQLDQEIVFIYQKVDLKDSDRSFNFKKLIIHNGEKAIASTQGNGEIKYDSAITTFTNQFKLLEIHRFDYDSLYNYLGTTQGQIKSLEISEKGIHSILKYKKEDIVVKTNKTHKFMGDTTFSWMDEAVPAIYFKTQYRVKVKHQYIPFLGEKRSYPGYAIYAKNIGLVRYGSSVDGEMLEWELTEIKKTEGKPDSH